MRLRAWFILSAFTAIVVVACAGKKSSNAELPPDGVWVQRPDGTRLCKTHPAEKLESVTRSLQESGVTVYASRHFHDGKMRAQLCGISTGWLNAFQIRRGDLVKAAALELQLPEAAEASEDSPFAADEAVSDARLATPSESPAPLPAVLQPSAAPSP